MRLRLEIGLGDAEAGVRAACSEAERQGWAITVAIVDAGGAIVAIARMDDCTPLAVDSAIGKARSAATTGLETSLIENMLSKRPALATMGRISVAGGVPILVGNRNVGGIGISGVRSEEDALVAHAALAALIAAAGSPPHIGAFA